MYLPQGLQYLGLFGPEHLQDGSQAIVASPYRCVDDGRSQSSALGLVKIRRRIVRDAPTERGV
jgi:hypothetical protein